MFIAPNHIHLAQGASEGRTGLNAFDNALMAAGIHNLNLMRVSSIVPKGASFGKLPRLDVGTLTPAVYSQVVSHICGETISACVGAGIGRDGGTLFEYHHEGSGREAERVVELMIAEGFERRGWELLETRFATAEHRVDRVGCACAAAVLWHTDWGHTA